MKNNIEFSTGNLTLGDNSVSFNNLNVRLNDFSTILREDIGHVIIEPVKMLPNAERTHCFQLITFGFIFSFVGFLIAMLTNTYLMFYLGIALILISSILLFSNLWLDSILELKMATPILNALFGVDYYRVVVQNLFGGSNLIFFIKTNEISRLPNIEKYKKDKINYLSRVIKRPILQTNSL